MFKSRLLTEEQINYIKENYGYKRTASIAEELSVTPRYVQKVASKLGVVDLKNKYYIKDNIAFILCVDLNDNHVYFKVDLEDLDRVLNYAKWFLKINKNKKYVVCNKEINGKRTIVRLHRFLLDFPNKDIDHIDGNSLNNCKSNLRFCEDYQNMSNLQKCRVDNKSCGTLNITVNRHGRYRPEVRIGKARVYFGSFSDLEEAKKLVRYVRANYIPFSQEALKKDEINEETPKSLKELAEQKIAWKLSK